eukprot:15462572-Alexandrium_andersonii.AAC.1
MVTKATKEANLSGSMHRNLQFPKLPESGRGAACLNEVCECLSHASSRQGLLGFTRGVCR